MTAKKDTRTFVLLDSYGDPVTVGPKATIIAFIEDIISWDGAEEGQGFSLFELGPQVPYSIEEKVEVFVG